MAVITYLDKDKTLATSDPRRKARDVDMNEIKSVVNTNAAHLALINNPHTVTASQVGLGSVDNTADAGKPVSTAQQTAIDLRALTSSFVENEVPAGTINSSNAVFTIANTPVSGSVKLYLDGMRMKITVDYTISGTTITFIIAPTTGSQLITDYRK